MSFFLYSFNTRSSSRIGPGSLRTNVFPVLEIPTCDSFLPQSLPNDSTHALPEDSRKILILDLDETLIHTSTFPPHKNVKCLTFTNNDTKEYVFLRPGVEEFLAHVAQMFEVFIFTAGTRGYAEPILDQLCPEIDQLHRFFRDSCNFSSKKCKKDLTKFGKPLSQVIMIDDNRHMKQTYPDNTIHIDNWNGTPYDDTLLNTVIPILEECNAANDVRTILSSYKKKACSSCDNFYPLE